MTVRISSPAKVMFPQAGITKEDLAAHYERVADLMLPHVRGRPVHQVGLPYHWGRNGLSKGDAANELSHMALDPNVHIQEVKASTCDIRPGRRPRGAALPALVEEYQRRAGITDKTGTEI